MDTAVEEVVAVIRAFNPVPGPEVERLRVHLPRLDLDELPRRRPSRRTVLIAGLTVIAFLAAGVAIAERVSPLAGIGAADHARNAQDVLPPSAISALHPHEAAANHWGPGSLLPSTSRLIGSLPSGRKIYVAATTTGVLEIIVTDNNKFEGASGVPPLSSAMPITITTFRQDRATKPISYGIVRDGITSVSFRGGGSDHTVKVKDNIWAYEGDSSALESITVHYADGRTQTITH
jgi:hypothetical protein